MAAKTSFKQQCPSCEAMVPIKDPKLIGRKIDCPKCKYRFVVEDPGTEEPEELEEVAPAKTGKKKASSKAPAKANGKAAPGKGKMARRDDDDDDDAPKPRAKGSDSQKKLFIGLGLAGAALVVLIIAVVIMAMKSNKPATPTNPPVAVNRVPAPSTDDSDDEKDAKNASTSTVAADDISDVLPGGTQMVLNLRVPDLLRTPVGTAALAGPGTYRSGTLRRYLGFTDRDVDRAIVARNFADNWVWVIVRTNADKPLNRKAVEAALHLTKPSASSFKGDYLVSQGNWVAASPVFQLGTEAAAPAPGSRPVYVHFIDDHTVVLADRAPMEEFLSKGGKFDLKTQPGTPAAPKEGDDQAGGDKGKGGQPNASEPPGGRPRGGLPPPPPFPGLGPPGGMPNVEQPKAAEVVQTTSYLTIDPSLKVVLDRLETNPGPKQNPFAATFAVDMTTGADLVKPVADLVSIKTPANVVGAALRVKESTLTCEVVQECPNEDAAKDFEKLLHDKIAELFPQIASLADNQVKGKFGEPKAAPRQQNPFGGGKFGGGGMPTMPMPPMQGGMGAMQQEQMMKRQQMGQGFGSPQGPGFGPPGMGPPGMFNKGGNRGRQGQQQDDDKSLKVVFTPNLELPRTVDLTIDVPLDPAVGQLLQRWLGTFWVGFKGQTDMVDAHQHVAELAGALKSYVEARKEFPAGTWQRPNRPGLDLPYPPDERVSWLVGLLPFLGHTDVSTAVLPQKSWHEAENMALALAVIPEFLDPANGPQSWRVANKNFSGLQPAATDFVGIAGVGLDAADPEFRQNLKNAGKLGIFGYDTPTKAEAVVDGLENTIAMIEVPAEYRGPWLAGGGSTVRGVPETHSVQPFVCTEYHGQKGTFAIMGDGTVRFIPATIKDEDFKALCTIAGKERVDPDRVAPKVEEIKTHEMKAQRLTAEDIAPVVPMKGATVKAAKSLSGWQRYNSTTGGFSVDLPAKPVEQTLNVGPAGQAMTAHVLIAENGNVRCAVTYTDLPPAVKGQAAEYWAGVKHGLSTGPLGKVVSEKPITLGRYEGREFEQQANGVKVLTRTYLVDNRSYSLSASPTVMTPSDLERFFGSFTLADGSKAGK